MGNSKVSLIKHRFFDKSSKEQTKQSSSSAALNDKDAGFSFKDEDFDLDLLQTEFSSLYQLFVANKQQWVKRHDLVAYMYYICNLMVLYYQYDYVRANLQKLEEQKKEIEDFVETHFSKQAQEAVYQLSEKLKALQSNNTHSLISIAQIRHYISILNANRSTWGYSRALANHAIVYLQHNCDLHLINGQNGLFGIQCISVEIVNFLDKTKMPLAVLGIALFGLRFLINLTLMLKHLIQAAIGHELSVKKVFEHELDKRGFTMASDLVWAIITMLTTYNLYFQIPSSAIAPLVLSFLIFDALLLIAQWSVEMVKYNKRLQELVAQEQNAPPAEQAIIKRQMDLLNDEWDAQCAYFLINVLAANIIFIAFAVSIVCSGVFILAGMAFLSMLGNALYNTAEEYKKYQQTKIAIRREEANGTSLDDEQHRQLMAKLHEQCDQANIEFWQTLGFNIGATAFIITAVVVSWPVALGLTLAYAAYRIYAHHQSQSVTPNKEPAPSKEVYRILELEQPEELAVTPCLP